MFSPHGKVKVEAINELNNTSVLIEPMAMAKMKTLVDECSTEVGWVGTASRHQLKDTTVYLIEDIYLLEQEANGTTCEMSPTGMTDLVTDMIKNNRIDEANKIRVWGHSHVNMGVSPSGQDDSQIIEFAGDNPWFIRIIANKKGDMKLDIYDYEKGIKHLNCDFQLNITYDYDELDKFKSTIKDKVKKKTYKTTTNNMIPGYHNYYQFYKSDNKFDMSETLIDIECSFTDEELIKMSKMTIPQINRELDGLVDVPYSKIKDIKKRLKEYVKMHKDLKYKEESIAFLLTEEQANEIILATTKKQAEGIVKDAKIDSKFKLNKLKDACYNKVYVKNMADNITNEDVLDDAYLMAYMSTADLEDWSKATIDGDLDTLINIANLYTGRDYDDDNIKELARQVSETGITII